MEVLFYYTEISCQMAICVLNEGVHYSECLLYVYSSVAFFSLHFLLLDLALYCMFDQTDCIISYYCMAMGGGSYVSYLCTVDGYRYVNCEAVIIVVQPTLTCISHCVVIGWYL